MVLSWSSRRECKSASHSVPRPMPLCGGRELHFALDNRKNRDIVENTSEILKFGFVVYFGFSLTKKPPIFFCDRSLSYLESLAAINWPSYLPKTTAGNVKLSNLSCFRRFRLYSLFSPNRLTLAKYPPRQVSSVRTVSEQSGCMSD